MLRRLWRYQELCEVLTHLWPRVHSSPNLPLQLETFVSARASVLRPALTGFTLNISSVPLLVTGNPEQLNATGCVSAGREHTLWGGAGKHFQLLVTSPKSTRLTWMSTWESTWCISFMSFPSVGSFHEYDALWVGCQLKLRGLLGGRCSYHGCLFTTTTTKCSLNVEVSLCFLSFFTWHQCWKLLKTKKTASISWTGQTLLQWNWTCE